MATQPLLDLYRERAVGGVGMITVHAVHAMYDLPQVLSRGMGIAATSFFEHESHNIFSNSRGTNRVDPHLTAATTFVSGACCFADKKNKRPQLD